MWERFDLVYGVLVWRNGGAVLSQERLGLMETPKVESYLNWMGESEQHGGNCKYGEE